MILDQINILLLFSFRYENVYFEFKLSIYVNNDNTQRVRMLFLTIPATMFEIFLFLSVLNKTKHEFLSLFLFFFLITFQRYLI